MDGERQLLHPQQAPGPWMCHTPSATPGMLVPHEYVITDERRRIEITPWKVWHGVARFVRTLPEEPMPPVKYDCRSPVPMPR
jgi:hypothetical protein